MVRAIRRLHTLVGLFALTSLVVFAATGLSVTFPPPQIPTTRVIAYEAPGGFSDKQVADDVLTRLKLPLVSPLPEWAIHRNAENVLEFEFFSPNGVDKVTVLEKEGKARIEHTRSSLGAFLNAMHSATYIGSRSDVRMRLWAFYVNGSMLSILFLSVTGPWLWLASRPRLRWAQASFVAGVVLFAGLWLVTR